MCVAKKMNPRVHPAQGARASSLVDRKSLLHSLLPKGLLQHDASCLMSASKSLPWWHVLRLVILGVLLFPIRLILMVFNVAGVLLVANIITCCGRKMPRSDKPLVGCRKATVSCCIRPAIRFQAFLLGVWVGGIEGENCQPPCRAHHCRKSYIRVGSTADGKYIIDETVRGNGSPWDVVARWLAIEVPSSAEQKTNIFLS